MGVTTSHDDNNDFTIVYNGRIVSLPSDNPTSDINKPASDTNENTDSQGPNSSDHVPVNIYISK